MKYILLSILLIILSLLHITQPVNSVFAKLFSPSQRNLTYKAYEIRDFFTFFQEMRSITDDYEHLYVEYQSLLSENAHLKYLQSENEELRKQLKIVNSDDILKNKKFVFAYVYTDSNNKVGSTLALDAGSLNGLSQGNVVIKDNTIIGVVKSVGASKSIVHTLTSPTLKIPVYNYSSREKTEGIVQGGFGTSITMTNILSNDEVKEGDVIMTSGRSGQITPNLFVGKVVKVEGDNASTVKTAFIESFVDYKKLKRVYVLLD